MRKYLLVTAFLLVFAHLLFPSFIPHAYAQCATDNQFCDPANDLCDNGEAACAGYTCDLDTLVCKPPAPPPGTPPGGPPPVPCEVACPTGNIECTCPGFFCNQDPINPMCTTQPPGAPPGGPPPGAQPPGTQPPPFLKVPPASTLPVAQPKADVNTQVESTIRFVLNLLITLGIAASVIWLLYGSVKYITAGGDKAVIEAAKLHMVAALIGLILLVFSFVIISLILSLFGTGGLSDTQIDIPTLL